MQPADGLGGGGDVSGGHFNPAVTLAVYLRGKCEARDVSPYWAAQFTAGLVAGLLVKWLGQSMVLAHVGTAVHPLVPSVIVEFLFTFALAWVVLNVATAKGTAGNSFYGLAIGMTVMTGAVAVGGVSGGAFNPAVGIGVVTMGLESAKQCGVYFLSDFAGAATAALAFKWVNETE